MFCWLSGSTIHQSEMETLFRKDAIQGQQALYGARILYSPRRYLNRLVSGLLLICTLILLAIWLVSYTKRIQVSGSLRSSVASVKLYSQGHGVVEQVYISEAEQVDEGQPLFKIRKLNQDIKELNLRRNGLQQQKVRYQQQLEELIKAQDRADRLAELENLAIADETTRLKGLIQLKNRQLTIGQQTAQASQQLFRQGLIARQSHQQTRQMLLEQEAELQRLALEEQRLTSRQISLDRYRQQDRLRHFQDRAQLIAELETIKEQLQAVDQRLWHDYLAPRNGVISNMQVQPGMQLNSNKLLAIIGPEKADLYADLYVPARHVALIKEQQLVNLKFDAYPYQEYGFGQGVVKEISRMLFQAQELDVPNTMVGAVYRVRVAMEKQWLLHEGQQLKLHPGMTLTADMMLDSRSIAAWIIEPLYSVGS